MHYGELENRECTLYDEVEPQVLLNNDAPHWFVSFFRGFGRQNYTVYDFSEILYHYIF